MSTARIRLRLGIGAVVLTLVAAACPAANSAAAPAPHNGVIAYSWVEQDEGVCDGCDDRHNAPNRSWIESVRPSGEDRRRLPCTTGSFETCDDQTPAFSPDGTRLAILNGSEIVIAKPNGDVLRRLPFAAIEVAWSPGRDRLAFTATYTAPPAPALHAVYVTRLRGTPRQVPGAAHVDPFSLSWSARGRLAWEKRGRKAGVYVSNPGGEGRRRILSAQGPPRLPRWSYDGRRLAYACGASLCEARPDGSRKRLLTRRCDMEFEPGGGMAWSPDGLQVACFGRFGDLIAVRLETGERRIVRRRPASARFLPFEMAWRPRATR